MCLHCSSSLVSFCLSICGNRNDIKMWERKSYFATQGQQQHQDFHCIFVELCIFCMVLHSVFSRWHKSSAVVVSVDFSWIHRAMLHHLCNNMERSFLSFDDECELCGTNCTYRIFLLCKFMLPRVLVLVE